MCCDAGSDDSWRDQIERAFGEEAAGAVRTGDRTFQEHRLHGLHDVDERQLPAPLQHHDDCIRHLPAHHGHRQLRSGYTPTSVPRNHLHIHHHSQFSSHMRTGGICKLACNFLNKCLTVYIYFYLFCTPTISCMDCASHSLAQSPELAWGSSALVLLMSSAAQLPIVKPYRPSHLHLIR